MKERRSIGVQALVLTGAVVIGGVSQAGQETVRNMLAAQIRSQGFACEKALGATRDAKRSKPDHAVWVLQCGNASYRVTRAPDMGAKVEPIK